MSTETPDDINILNLLNQAISYHNKMQFVEAKNIYQEILSLCPNHFDSLHLLGVIAYQTGSYQLAIKNIESAIAVFQTYPYCYSNLGLAFLAINESDKALDNFNKAIELKPDYAEAYCNRGNALRKQKKFKESILDYDKAISIKSDYFEAFSNRGNAFHEIGEFDAALSNYDIAIQLNPNYAVGYGNRGTVLYELRLFKSAIVSFDKAISLDPNYAEAFSNRGVALRELGYLDSANISYNQAISLNPSYAEAYYNLGLLFHEKKNFQEAIKNYNMAIKCRDEYVEAYSNLGNALLEYGDITSAIASYDFAIKINKDHAEAYYNKGNAYIESREFSKALECYDKAIMINPNYSDAYHNKGHALKEIKQLDAAIEQFTKSIELDDTNPNYRYSRGLAYLTQGNFLSGFNDCEWRTGVSQPLGIKSFSQPLWLGCDNLSQKSILIHHEQGFGDTIQMCRYLKNIEKLGAKILFAPQKKLQNLMRGLDVQCTIVDREDPCIEFDFHCPMMSMPLAFKTNIDTVPSSVPYLRADPKLIAKWKERIGDEGFKIGICWQGSTHKNALGRSFPLELFFDISKISNVRLISLHKGEGEIQLLNLPDDMKVEVLGSDFDTSGAAFADTAAVMMCCDLVITCDTAITVLAGALGVKTWIALKYVPHWFWLLDRDDSPWYPTIRLFRQHTDGCWKSVFLEIIDELRKIA